MYYLADCWLPPALKRMPSGSRTPLVSGTVAVCPICFPGLYLAGTNYFLYQFEMRAVFCSYAGVTHVRRKNPEVVRFTQCSGPFRKRPKVK